MKILVVSQYFYPENFIINDLLETISKKNHQITVLTGKPNYPNGIIFPGYNKLGILRENYNSINVIRVPIIPRKKSNIINLFINYCSFIISGLLFFPFLVKKNNCDIIFSYLPSPITSAIPAIFLSFLKKKKLILWVQDIWPDNLFTSNKLKSRFLLKTITYIVKFIYYNSDCILISSPRFINNINSLSKNKKIIYFPNSFSQNFNIVKNPKIEKYAKLIKENFSIVFAGNIGTFQSLYTVIDSAEKIKNPKIKIFIIGDGSEKIKLTQYASSKNITNVVFLDSVKSEFIYTIIRNASGLIISLKRDDTLNYTIPSKFQMYLSTGIPIIGSINGDVAKLIIENNLGLIAPSENALSLSKIINKLYDIKDTDMYFEMKKNCSNFFNKNYNMKTSADTLLNIFANIYK